MRKPRDLREHAEYHVVARANRQEFIFETKEIKDLFLSVVCRAKQKYSFTIRNFCIMSNHFHMLIHPENGESLSKIMQWILSVFAAKFNRFFGYVGHVWYDRFKSVVVNSLRQFVAVFNYITVNPVKAAIVRDAFDYAYLGLRHIRDGDFSVVAPPDELVRLLFPAYTAPLLTSS
ncbi:MAG: transposase [Spirochaeta sp.]|jgi:putative transposase|nr:transposase [Spirochaeta sp.]